MRLIICTLIILSLQGKLFADNHVQECTGAKLPLITSDQIIEAIGCQTNGNVLKLEEVSPNESTEQDEFLARVLLPDGRIRIYLVNGTNGNLILDKE